MKTRQAVQCRVQLRVVHHHRLRQQSEEGPRHAALRHRQVAHAEGDAAIGVSVLLARHGGITDGLRVTSAIRHHIHELRTPHKAQLRQPVAGREVQADRLHLSLL